MGIETLSVKYENKTVNGLFYKPDNMKEKCPLVVCCHGFGSKYEWLMEYAKQFSEAGACVAIFDFCGGGPESRSSGSPLDLSVLSEARDAKAVLEYYKSMDFIDDNNVFLLGESMGGMVATIIAAESPEDFKAIMLLYPGYVMEDNARKAFATIDEIPDTYDAGRMIVGGKFYRDLYNINTFSLVEKIKCPVCILHGDADNVVPLSYSEKAVEIFENASLTIYPGLGHGFEGEDIIRRAEKFTLFLKENT